MRVCVFLLLSHPNSLANASSQYVGNRLHLWQVFFANRNEWRDQRKSKLNPEQLDFRHKVTGEALWLSKYNPPWFTRQLKLLDSKVAESGFAGRLRGKPTPSEVNIHHSVLFSNNVVAAPVVVNWATKNAKELWKHICVSCCDRQDES